jgi:hypothetical protein
MTASFWSRREHVVYRRVIQFSFVSFAIAIAIKPNYVISATKQQFAR